MMRLVPTPEELPPGSHSLGLFASRPEAARNMASFLRGARARSQKAVVYSSDDQMLELYRGELARQAPELRDSLRRIPGPHIRRTSEGFRPLSEVMEFAAAHPEGATMAGDTIPGLLDRRNLSQILGYEEWYDTLRPFPHRGLCPYDISHLPVDRASEAFGRLAGAHSHGVLSQDPNPGVRFLQLLILPHVENPPKEHLGWLAQAVDYGLITQDDSGESAGLTPRGENFARGLMALPAFVQRATDSSRSRGRIRQTRDDERRSPRFSPEE
jgi:hypothetical protein